MFSVKKTLRLYPNCVGLARMYSPTGSGLQGDAGSGAGRGGGGGGSIRDAGGSFAKMEIAHEEEYFYRKQREQLEKLKGDQIKQEHFHEEAIKDLQEQIKRHSDYLKKLKK